MEQKELRGLEDRCIQEYAPPCTAACSIHVDVRGMMSEISRGDLEAALKIVRKTLPFPGIIGRICEQPCRAVCNRKNAGGSLAVAALEQACADLGAHQPEKKPAMPRLKSTLLTMDHVPQAIVRAVEDAWGCKVYNHYGTTEMGLGGGVECQARRGYHLREADLYIEVVDPKTGRVVDEGNPGEVVFTTLTRRGMPLIRYRTGDLSRFIPGDCPCGTVLRTLEKLRTPFSGIVTLGDHQTLAIADLDEALFPIAGVWNFAASVDREGEKDFLRVEIQGTPETKKGSLWEALETISALRVARCAGTLRIGLSLRAEGPFEVPGPAKRMIVDRRTPSD